jgi:hypothetical protein
MPHALLIGLGAGLVSAVLFASASTGTLIGLFILFLLSPLPVAIAGLGWGWTTAAVAAAGGAALVAIAGSPRAAVFYVLALGLPTVILVYLILLNREVAAAVSSGTNPEIAWYPLGRIVTVAALWAGGLGVLALQATASDIEGLRAVLRETFESAFVKAMPLPPAGERGIGESEIAALTELMVVSFAGAVATTWMAIALFNLWLAGIVTRKSGRLVRPWPDLSALTLPRSMPLAFASAIALTILLPGYTGLMASAFASAFMFAFMLVGLAIIHNVTRGHGLRPAILGAVYVALVVFNPLSSLIVGMVGLAEPFSPLRRRPPPSSPPPTT